MSGMAEPQVVRFIEALQDQIARCERLRGRLGEQGCGDLADHYAAVLTGLRLALELAREIWGAEERGA